MQDVIYIQYVSRALGAWKWINSRGYYRVGILPGYTYSRMQSGDLSQLHYTHFDRVYEGAEFCGDYEGGQYGYGGRLEIVKKWADELAAEFGYKIIL